MNLTAINSIMPYILTLLTLAILKELVTAL